MMKQTAPACPHGSCRNTLSDSYPLLVHLRAVFFANVFSIQYVFPRDLETESAHSSKFHRSLF